MVDVESEAPGPAGFVDGAEASSHGQHSGQHSHVRSQKWLSFDDWAGMEGLPGPILFCLQLETPARVWPIGAFGRYQQGSEPSSDCSTSSV